MTRTFSRTYRLSLVALLAAAVAVPALAVTEISSCQALTQAGETYRLVSDLSSSATCLSTGAANITIDGNGHTLTFNPSGNNSGIVLAHAGASIHDITVDFSNGTYTGQGGAAIWATPTAHVYSNTIRIHSLSNGTPYGIKTEGAGERNIHHNTIHADGHCAVVAILAKGNSGRTVGPTGSIHDNTIEFGGSLKQCPGGRPSGVGVTFSNPTSGRLAIHGNQISTTSGVANLQGIWLYRADDVDMYENTVSFAGSHGRPFLLDDSGDNTIHHNTVTMTGSGSPTAGIRMRYSSNRNDVYENAIDATGCGNNCYALSLGAENGNPTGNTIHHNVLAATDEVVHLEGFYQGGNALYNNHITVRAGAGENLAYKLYENVSANPPRNVSSVLFAYETIVNEAGRAAMIKLSDADDVTFCHVTVDGEELIAGQVTTTGSVTGLTVQSEGACAAGEPPVPACSDGEDNDGDGQADHPNDPGCTSEDDPSENQPGVACDDGVDADADGLDDYPEDPGCASITDTDENNCGNETIDGTEDCEGPNLAEASCESEGFDRGTLTCGDDCRLNTSQCIIDCTQIESKQGWSVAYVDSEETSPGWQSLASNAIDSDPATFWHTEWVNEPVPGHSHEIHVDLGATRLICGFDYLPRQDSGPESMDGSVREYLFYVSTDGADWGVPVKSGELVPAGSVDRSAVAVRFWSVEGRYVRLVAESDSEGTPFTSMGELDILHGDSGLPEEAPAAPTNLGRTDTYPGS